MKTLKRTLSMLLVLCMVLSFVPFGAFAAATTGTTQNQPFPSGTGGSTYFRIPALTVLSDGTLVAAADARWSQYMDKGNIDTIVSVSEDKGANWNYTFANYIDDGGDTYNISAATFIDPAMAVKTVDGVETIFMVADLFPGQKSGDTMCINAALYGTGMDANGHLLVSDVADNDLSQMNYYVGDYTNGMAPLCNSNGTDTDYTVDEWFNVYKGNTLLGNLFTYGDANDSDAQKTFYVYQTCYLVLTKSTDGGETWSAPTMLNHQVKASSEKFYGVGPASGFVTSTGRIMFTAYTYTTADGNSSVFYSDDNGVTWTRAASVAEQTSEACLTEANGTIYMFTRHGNYYYYSTDNGTTWSGAQTASGISYLDSCELSVMTYSEKIDGKTAILLSAPTASGRYGGKIFVGLVNDDHSITWKYTYAVNTTSDRYQYSSLKELNDGSLGLLYENGDASIVYKNIAIADVIGEDAVIGTPEKTINMTVGDEKTFTLDEVVNSGSHTSDAADITWTKNDTTVSVPAAKLGTDTSFSGSTIDLNDCLYTFTKNSDGTTWLLSADVNGTTVYIDAHAGASNGGYPNRTYTTNITLINGSNGGIQIYDGAGYLHFYDTDGSKLYWDQCTGNTCSGHNLKIYKVADPASTTVLGGYYEQVTDIANLEDGGKYLIVGYNSSNALAGYYAMHPSVSTGDKYSHLAKITGDFTDITTSETTVKIEAKAVGNTSIVIGSTKYTINVSTALDNVVDVELKVDGIFTDTLRGVYVESGSTENDIVSASWVGTEATSSYATATLGDDANYNGSAINVVDCLYTFTASGSGFVVQSKANPDVYLNTTKNSAGYPNATESNVVNLSTGNTENSFYMLCNPQNNENSNKVGYLHFYRNGNNRFDRVDSITTYEAACSFYLYRPAGDGDVSSTEIPGYVRVTAAYNEVTDGDYLIAAEYNGAYYLLHPSTSTSDKYAHVAKVTGQTAGTDTPASTEISITAKTVGNTSVEIGGTTYNITVTLPEGMSVVDVELEVDETTTITDESGVYTSATTEPDSNVVEMELKPVETVTGTEIGEAVTTITEGKYVIFTYLDAYVINQADGNYIDLSTTEQTVWNVAVADSAAGTYYITDSDGNYLYVGNGTAGVTDTETAVKLVYGQSGDGPAEFGFFIQDANGSYNLNNSGETNNAYGKSGAVGSWSRWQLKPYSETVDVSTVITFTGVSEGKTSAIVGNTLYRINVIPAGAIDVDLQVSESKEYINNTGSVQTGYDTNVARVTLATQLIPVTSIVSGKQYLIVNKSTGDVLTDEAVTVTGDSGDKDGLQTSGKASVDSAELWTITAASDGRYTVVQDGNYLAIAGFVAFAGTNYTPELLLNYTADGWTICDDKTWDAMDPKHDEAGYYLSDNVGEGYSGGALGTSSDTNPYMYWDIYEIGPVVTITGRSVGDTVATVGTVQYYITVSKGIVALDAYLGINATKPVTGTVTDNDIAAFNAAHGATVTVALKGDNLVFTAVAPGTVTAMLGATEYTITVPAEEVREITLYEGVATREIIAGAAYDNFDAVQPDNTKAYIHGVTNDGTDTTIVFTGVAAGTTEAQVGHVKYNITVKSLTSGGDIEDFTSIVGEGTYSAGSSTLDLDDKVIKSLRITEGASFDVGVDVTGDFTIEWSSADESIATVDDDGTVTAVKAGTTMVTATVTKDGVTEAISVNVTVVPSMLDGNDGEVSTIFFYIDEVYNTDPYYTLFVSSESKTDTVENHEMIMVVEGEVIWYERPKSSAAAILWTADPWDNHALTFMSSTGSLGQYYPLKNDDNELGEGTVGTIEYYKGNYAYNSIIDNGATDGANWTNSLNRVLENSIHVGENYWLDPGCDGAMSFSRFANDNNVVSALTFVSDRLPELDKSIYGVLSATGKRENDGWQLYHDGMYATVGQYIYYTITVTQERPHTWQYNDDGTIATDDAGNWLAALEYTNDVNILDRLMRPVVDEDGNVIYEPITYMANPPYFYTKELDAEDGNHNNTEEPNDDGYIVDTTLQSNKQPVADLLNAGWSEDQIEDGQRVYEFYVVYKIQDQDNNTMLVNGAGMNYEYSSAYSSGTHTATATAAAEMYILGESLGDLVVDFGLPVTLSGLTTNHLADQFNEENTNNAIDSAKYGYVDITDNNDGTYSVTYTPDRILQGYDVVYLMDDYGNLVNYFRVYPATTVYYEEGFLFTGDVTGNWQPESKNMGNGPQETETLGEKKNDAYGYDAHYANHSTGSDSSVASSTAVGDKTVFTFTGTGFELYANSTSGSGYVTLYSEGKLSKIYMIDTKLTDLDGKEMSGTYYSLPIISEKTLPYGEYTVYLMHSNDSAPISIDGIRIINTIEDSKIFVNDEEDDPVFYELRDYVLNAIDVEKLTESDYISSEDRVALVHAVSDMAGQVYNAMGEDVAVVINEDGTSFKPGEAQKLLDNGPKNELYLYSGQTLVFSVNTARVMQLGLKSPVGDAKFTLTVNGQKHALESLSTTVDMFYKIANKSTTPVSEDSTEMAPQEYIVSITVNDGVLSVTDLKICDDPNFTFNALTEKDVENVMLGMYGLLPELPVNPFEDVADDAFYYDAVLWALENSITTGTEATIFAPDSITNRAQVVTFLWRAMGEPAHNVVDNPFEDVAEDAFYYDAVLWAYENGITTGTDVNHFNPTGECNRAQVVTFLWRTVGEPVSEFVAEFEDVEPGKFYSEAVAWAIEKGITFGMDDATFGVLNPCNRAQVVTFLYRASSK